MENIYQVLPELALIPGLSYNVRNSIKAEDYIAEENQIVPFPSNDNDALNAQLGIFWETERHTLTATVARKTRFATIKDRYSYRLGAAIPNPDLKAEYAVHYDLTYQSGFSKKIALNTSIYYSDIEDVIQQVNNVAPGTIPGK